MAATAKRVSIGPTVLACLTAGHLHNLWQQTQDGFAGDGDRFGCCNVCCSSCWALKQMLDTDVLDVVYQRFLEDNGAGSSVWDDEKQQVDRTWLLKAWAVDLGCGEDHLAMVK